MVRRGWQPVSRQSHSGQSIQIWVLEVSWYLKNWFWNCILLQQWYSTQVTSLLALITLWAHAYPQDVLATCCRHTCQWLATCCCHTCQWHGKGDKQLVPHHHRDVKKPIHYSLAWTELRQLLTCFAAEMWRFQWSLTSPLDWIEATLDLLCTEMWRMVEHHLNLAISWNGAKHSFSHSWLYTFLYISYGWASCTIKLKENRLLDDILAENSKINQKGRGKSPLFVKSWGVQSKHRAFVILYNTMYT